MLLPADDVWITGKSPATYMCWRLKASDEGRKSDTLADPYLRSASVSFW